MDARRYGKWRLIGYLTLLVIGVALFAATAAFANGATRPVTPTPVTPTTPRVVPTTPSCPADIGAGCLTWAGASNIAPTAYIYTGSDWVAATPQQTTGSIQIFACAAPSASAGENATPSAEVVSKFTYNGSQYTVRFTCVLPNQMGFEGVSILRPVFGGAGPGLPGITLPRTMSYVSVFGNATITKDGQTIAQNQPAIAMVTQAIHDPSFRLLTEGDPTRREAHLFVPGSMIQGGTGVQSFNCGGFYIFWPAAAAEIRNVGGTVQLGDLPLKTVAVPATPARGPVVPMQLDLTITDNGIQSTSTRLPAGLYTVTITNNSTKAKGLFMSGTDVCCTEFNRFSQILEPGKSQTFPFYFASGPVEFRDMLSCKRGERTCAVATYGPFSSSITFQ